MTSAFCEPDTVKVLEDNLVRCLRRLNGKDREPNSNDIKYKTKLLKALEIFYKSINKSCEGSELKMSRV